MDGNFTLFRSTSSAGTNASDFLKDAFQDFSLLANSNTGLSSTVSKNPLSFYLGNPDAPRYGIKTLWIDDLVLIEDRSRWIDNKPTYEVIWSTPDPAVKGYAAGNIRLKTVAQGTTVEIRNIDDLFGITGVVRQVAWILNPTVEAAGSADLVTNGVDTGNDITFNTLATNSDANGVNHYAAFLHNAVAQDKNIHDYRIVANQYKTMRVAGVIVYFENATSDIDCFPGNTYIDKEKVTTTSITSLALPTVASRLGAKSVVQKTSSSSYQLVTEETPEYATIGVGASGTNLIDVTTGQGGSFPIGTGLLGLLGSSFYIGTVTNQSTDTLTVSPTLPIGVSGTILRAWQAGPTLPISATLYNLAYSIDPFEANVNANQSGFGQDPLGGFYYSDPALKFRMWGNMMTMQPIEGAQGIAFLGASAGFFQLDGEFCAAELQFAGAGVLHGTFTVNGVPVWGVNEGLTGMVKKTVFTNAGPGWNSFRFSAGASYLSVNLCKINLYERKNPESASFGVLSSFNTFQTKALRFSAAHNASLIPLGGWQRTYADSLYFSGAWTRGSTFTFAGGVYYMGISTNSTLKFQYYGTDYAILGQAGISAIISFDGASTAVTLNQTKSVATLGFHTIQYSDGGGGTSIISAVDFLRPTVTELKNEQTFVADPIEDPGPRFFIQYPTPSNPRNGDFWAQDKNAKIIWFYMYDLWNRIDIVNSTDDPNDAIFVSAFGSSEVNTSATLTSSEHFNFSSWVAGVAGPTGKWQGQLGEGQYKGVLYYIDGADGSNVVALATFSYNKVAWATNATRATARGYGGVAVLGNVLVVSKGSTNLGFANAGDGIDTFNGSSWVNAVATYTTTGFMVGSFVRDGVISLVGGYTTSNAYTNVHDTWNGTSTGTSTAYPATDGPEASSAVGVNGYAGGHSSGGTGSYVWSGSWSASITMSYVVNSQGGGNVGGGPSSGSNSSNGKGYISHGNSSSTNATTSAASLNGISWASETSANVARTAPSGGVF